jgi:5-methylcytosine-specific restriction endonuclease McrA
MCGYNPLKKRNESLNEDKELKDYSCDYFDSCFVADHIEPISCGGDEWDLENLQTLCIKCNKEKTKSDMGDIAKYRLKELLVKTGQKLFEDE